LGNVLAPFEETWALIRKSERIQLTADAHFWQAQHGQAARKITALEGELAAARAEIKELRNRLFGKKSEKEPRKSSESNDPGPSERKRGQRKDRPGHGRTPRDPDLQVVEETLPFDPSAHLCPDCHLPPIPNPALDEVSEIKEVQVNAYVRHIRRPAYQPGCRCNKLPAILLPPPAPRLFPRASCGVSFWLEILVTKFHHGLPTHRRLRDLADQRMPVSPGTVTGGLQQLAPLFEPLVEALYVRQMGEELFQCDETRWEVFVKLTGKVGHRWYLWLTRSPSVIFYSLDPSRAASVPGAHFAGLQGERAIIVCDRYSAYKKLARLAEAILLAFCWAHVRRDFLEAGRGFVELEGWALEWKARIGELYHINHQRLEHWDPERPLAEQGAAFQTTHQALATALESVQAEAKRLAAPEPKPTPDAASAGVADQDALAKPARTEQRKIARSLLEHWPGLRLFLDHPEVPMDNNRAENAIRGPVNGRKNYYGSGSLWSADLTAMLFSLFQTLGLWGIPLRPWLQTYLQACADNGGQAPTDITPFLPWSLAEAPIPARRAAPITPDTS
jgi:transposase